MLISSSPTTSLMPLFLNLTIAEPGPRTILNVRGNVKCVVVTVSGRTEGQGVADVLFGDDGFTGKLPRTWFKTVDQLHMNVGDSHYDPLFSYDFGLTTKPVNAS
ncbi:periplasmic beta-glucosidase-like [Populus alba x Populus x berolinensis]|uniref:beta-glucosidase n=1 Tax=Populus alba x Populus x berolinensis TaxID=444605 RepID=A0AAD6QB65_9ROSI|nr:periplasmic beta-glucosidase-like [Populus alba x Populus x berolinensis]